MNEIPKIALDYQKQLQQKYLENDKNSSSFFNGSLLIAVAKPKERIETMKSKIKMTVDEIINGISDCPFPINVIPNNMGINLASVDSIEWERQDDSQLVALQINFIPDNKTERTETMNGVTSAQMPKYRCIKDVWALKIKSISFDEIEQKSISEEEEVATITPEEEGFAQFRISFGYCNKHNPQKGGYYVVYKDGYKSFSPAKAFEEGYVRI